MTEKVIKQKRTVSVQSHIDDYNSLLDMLDREIERKSKEREKGVRSLRKTRKRIERMKKDIPSVIKSSRSGPRKGNQKNNVFFVPRQITPEFAKFLQVPEDTKLTRVEATNAICVYANLKEDEERDEMKRWAYLNTDGRDLRNPEKRKVIVPDKALNKLLKYDAYKKDVARGKVQKYVRNKETGIRSKVVVTDDSLYYWVIQRLLSVHFSSVSTATP